MRPITRRLALVLFTGACGVSLAGPANAADKAADGKSAGGKPAVTSKLDALASRQTGYRTFLKWAFNRKLRKALAATNGEIHITRWTDSASTPIGITGMWDRYQGTNDLYLTAKGPKVVRDRDYELQGNFHYTANATVWRPWLLRGANTERLRPWHFRSLTGADIDERVNDWIAAQQ
jgi:hypothetical protein